MPLPSRSNVSRPRAWGYHALLDDLYLRLVSNSDLQTNPQIRTIRPEATRIDTGQNPEDFISEIGQTFSRAQFAGGEGLGFAHREGSAKNRFWDSDGIDVVLPEPGERHAARLLADTDVIASFDDIGIGEPASMVTDGGSVWIKSGVDTVHRSDDPLAASPTWTDDTPPNTFSIQQLAIIGGEVYAGAGVEGIHKRDTTGTWSKWSDLTDAYVFAVKQRIMAAKGVELYEARSGANSVLLATLPNGESWLDVADGGSHILAGTTDGFVYAFSVNESTGDLTLETKNDIHFGEVESVLFVGGLVLILTRINEEGGAAAARLWRAQLANDGTISGLDLVRKWDYGTSSASLEWTNTLATDGEHVYIGLTEYQETDDTWRMGLWRYSLATGGVTRHLDSKTSIVEPVTDVLFIYKRVLFSISNNYLIREKANTHPDSGYLITPAADFFTALDKSWSDIDVEAEIPSGTEVGVWFTTDLDAMDDPGHTSWRRAMRLTGAQGEGHTRLRDVESRFIAVMLKWYTDSNNTSTPKVNAVSVTATVVADEVEVTLPVNVSDQIELPGRKRHNLRGLGAKVYDQLTRREGRSVLLELLNPNERIEGTLWSVETPVLGLSPSGSPTLVSTITVRGRRAPLLVSGSGDGIMGVGLMGHMHMGGKDDPDYDTSVNP